MKSLEGFKSYIDKKRRPVSSESPIFTYVPHIKQRQFHTAGSKAKERLFLAGNRQAQAN